MSKYSRAFANMLIDKKNVNNVCGIPNTPVGRAMPKKKDADVAAKKKKK